MMADATCRGKCKGHPKEPSQMALGDLPHPVRHCSTCDFWIKTKNGVCRCCGDWYDGVKRV